jgi:hypothetical protein
MSHEIIIAKYKKRDAAPFISRPYRDTMVYDEVIEDKATILKRVNDNKVIRDILVKCSGEPDGGDYRIITWGELADIIQLLANARDADHAAEVALFVEINEQTNFEVERLVFRLT